MEDKIFFLDQSELPDKWFNPLPLFDEPLKPPLDGQTGEPVAPEKLQALLPGECVAQENCQQTEIDIPEEVLDVYKIWRPTPLYRASNLEEVLETPAKIFFKYEGASPPGSHKPNTAVAQAYYAQREGTHTLTTETGAGQWGSALSFATSHYGLDCKVFMVKVSYEQKPFRRSMINVWNADVIPSPSEQTEVGRSFLEEDPDTLGSLGMAISEAIEVAGKSENVKYSLGSVLNHVLIHQSIIGLETKKQLEKAGEKPDVLVGCTGGGSNFGGFLLPFLPEVISGREDIDLVSCEPTASPTLTEGEQRYDYTDSGEMTPKIFMYTLGHDFVPPGIHAGGLRYHGMAPIICRLKNRGDLTPVSLRQTDVFEDAMIFANAEGFIPAPETAHAVKTTMDLARQAREEGTSPTIAFNFSGHGHFDMSAYDDYLAGKLDDVNY